MPVWVTLINKWRNRSSASGASGGLMNTRVNRTFGDHFFCVSGGRWCRLYKADDTDYLDYIRLWRVWDAMRNPLHPDGLQQQASLQHTHLWLWTDSEWSLSIKSPWSNLLFNLFLIDWFSIKKDGDLLKTLSPTSRSIQIILFLN